jgi:hypothetical protein
MVVKIVKLPTGGCFSYINELGIEEAVKSAGKEVPLYELVRRLAKEGKFRY